MAVPWRECDLSTFCEPLRRSARRPARSLLEPDRCCGRCGACEGACGQPCAKEGLLRSTMCVVTTMPTWFSSFSSTTALPTQSAMRAWQRLRRHLRLTARWPWSACVYHNARFPDPWRPPSPLHPHPHIPGFSLLRFPALWCFHGRMCVWWARNGCNRRVWGVAFSDCGSGLPVVRM